MKKSIVAVLVASLLICSASILPLPVKAQEYAWKTVGTLPTPLARFAMGVHEGRVYLIGGWTAPQTPSKNVYYASILSDGSIGEWHSTTPLPDGRSWNSQQEPIVYNDKIYVIGGYSPYEGEKDTVWYASINPDCSLGNWITTTSLPVNTGSHVTVLWNGRIYVIGGWTGYGWLNTVYYASINADGSLSSWVSTTSLPEPRGHEQAGTVNEGIVYELGGQYYGDISNQLHDTVYYGKIRADGEIEGWLSSTSLPSQMGGHRVSVLGDRMYLIGGWYSCLLYTSDAADE